MGIFFDEGAARRHVVTHQHGECTLCIGGVLDGNLPEDAAGGIHGGFPQLGVAHFTKSFVTLHGYALVRSAAEFGGGGVALGVGPAVALLCALLHQIERRSCQIYVPVLDEVEHVAEEEGEDEAGNMTTVNIGIGHDVKEALKETTLSAEELEKQLPMYEAVWGNMSKWMESYEIKDVEMSDDKESAKVWYSYKYKDGREEKNFVSVKKVDGKWKVD